MYSRFGSFQAMCIYEDKIYVVDRFIPMLLEYNMIDMAYKVISYAVMPYDRVREGVVSMFRKKDEFFITLDNRLADIIVYNIKTDTYEEYTSIECRELSSIWYSYYDDERVFIFPSDLSIGFTIFDINKKEFSDIQTLFWDAPIINNRHKKVFGRVFVEENNYLFFPLTNNFIIEFSKAGQEVKRYRLPERIEIENIAYSEGVFFISSYSEPYLWEWSLKDGIVGEFYMPSLKKNNDCIINVCSMYANKDYVICSPYLGGVLSVLDLKTYKEIVIDTSLNCQKVYSFSDRLFNRGKIIGDRFLLAPYTSDSFIWIEPLSRSIEIKSSLLSGDDVEVASILMDRNNGVKYMTEKKDGYSLRAYLNGMKHY